jgi:hypothetical protein
MEISRAPALQPAFDRALALLHNFWYARALARFQEIQKADPDCAMAYWGAAMTYNHRSGMNRRGRTKRRRGRRCRRDSRPGRRTITSTCTCWRSLRSTRMPARGRSGHVTSLSRSDGRHVRSHALARIHSNAIERTNGLVRANDRPAACLFRSHTLSNGARTDDGIVGRRPDSSRGRHCRSGSYSSGLCALNGSLAASASVPFIFAVRSSTTAADERDAAGPATVARLLRADPVDLCLDFLDFAIQGFLTPLPLQCARSEPLRLIRLL